MNWFFKFNVGLKTLLHQGLSEPEFYGDLIYKFKNIVRRAEFSDQFKKIIVCYKRIGYNINIMRQSACLVFCLLLGTPGFNCWFSFNPVIQWCCSAPGDLRMSVSKHVPVESSSLLHHSIYL